MAPDQLSRLMEETMASTSPTTSRHYWRGVAAAAAVLVVAAGGWLFGSHQAVQPQAPSVPAAAIQLTAGSQLAKCRPPEAGILAGGADFAFAGTVVKIDGPEVTLSVTSVFRGSKAEQVQITLDGSSESLMGGTVAVGGNYLIASDKGALVGCGYSGTSDTPGLAELYQQAFSG